MEKLKTILGLKINLNLFENQKVYILWLLNTKSLKNVSFLPKCLQMCKPIVLVNFSCTFGYFEVIYYFTLIVAMFNTNNYIFVVGSSKNEGECKAIWRLESPNIRVKSNFRNFVF